MENNKKKITLLVGVCTLLITVIGATFAYFNMVDNNILSTTDIYGKTSSLGTVVLETIDKNIFIDLGIDEMSSDNIGKIFYSSNDESIPYNEEIKEHEILRTSVVGGEKGLTYNCTYTISIAGSGFESLNERDGYIVIDGEEIDLVELKSSNPIEREIEVIGISNEIEDKVKGYAYINNKESDQSYLSGFDLSLEIRASNLECKANFGEGPTIEVYTLGDNSGYTNNDTIEIYFEYTDDDAEEYCLTEEEKSRNCEWESLEETTSVKEIVKLAERVTKSKKVNYRFDSIEEGKKEVNVYIRDKYDNIAGKKESIILDKTAPNISNIVDLNDGSIEGEITDNYSEVVEYCLNESREDTSACDWIETTVGNIKTDKLAEVSGTYYIHLKDKVKNIRHVETELVVLRAFAIYSETDNSLRFYKNTERVLAGDTYKDLVATAVYTGFEEDEYTYSLAQDGSGIIPSSITTPWYEYADSIKTVVVEEEIQPTSMKIWFNHLRNVSSLDVEKIDTSSLTHIGYMFGYTGYNVTNFKITGLDNWDTSKVTNMGLLFYNAGYKATTWSIGDLSGWDTSSVTNMNGLFYDAGHSATTWSIGNLSNWNTSNVTNFENLFRNAGYSASTFNVGNLNNWNTSKATLMGGMFLGAGYKATTWNIGNISGWNTANVTSMSGMFYVAGYSATKWSIGNISGWNTAKVTTMRYMFNSAGYKASYTLNLSKWNVKKVTDHHGFNANSESKVTAPTWVN